MEPKVLLLVAFTAGAFAGPISSRVVGNPSSCSRQCTESKKFKYTPGVTYEFDYDVRTRTAMAGASEDHAALQIRANVQIEVITRCEFALKLSNVAIYRSDAKNPSRMEFGDNSGDFQRSLEAFPLRFSFQDGTVEEICPEEGDTKWALNIKRGVLSTFQNGMHNLERDERVHESDVTGKCFTNYRVTQRGWRSSTIRKSRDLLACEDRHGYRTAFHSLPYKIPNTIQSLPLMKSVHDCDQVITSEGLLQKTSCTETHVFRPFSKDNNGAMTEASQTLQFRNKINRVTTRPGIIVNRANLAFQHEYGTRDENKDRQDAIETLKELCKESKTDIRPDVPRLFSKLVYIMKNMDFRSMNTLFRELQRGDICRDNAERTKKFFIDAVPMVGSSNSVRLIRELIESNDVKPEQGDMWLTSLAFIQNPTKEILSEIEPLMNSKPSNMKAILSISSLVNNYCEQNPSCQEDYEVTKILNNLEGNIDAGCMVQDKNLEKTLITLRAIGNAGHSERLGLTLQRCLIRRENPAEVRVAAIEAFRRLSCEADRNDVMEIYRNSDEDSELRIAAYLTMMQCPVRTILTQVKATLETEKANQVGSFVWSHLMNLLETSCPLKQNIREILEDEDLKREFDLDKRKFSRNYEGSFFWEKFNMGAMAESNVIWSSKSFIPRSAMLNLTVDLFGKSLNLLEFGGRVEGLEYLIESYFGPEGYFSKKTAKKEYKDSRSIRKEKLQRTKEKFGQLKDELRGSLYMRVFGNELRYMHFNGLESPESREKFNILEHLIKLSKDHDYSFSQSIMFIDSSIIIPTGTGLPLNLTVNGTATIDMKASGKMDLRKLGSKPRSLLIDGQVQPSGAVEISSMMSVDAFVTKAGLKMVSTFHSSSSVKGRLELAKGQIFSLEFDMPQDKMEFFDVKSSFFIVHDKVEKEQKMIEENRRSKKVCWGDGLSKITGVELCGEIGFPNASINAQSPYFPFTGPVSMGFTLLKRDTLSGYKMVIKTIQNKEKTFAQLAFNTPGSRVDRALSVEVAVNYKDTVMEMSLMSPWKKTTAKGSFVNERKLKKVQAIVLVDSTDEYAFESEVQIDKKGQKVTYTPSLEIRRPKIDSIRIDGTISMDALKKINADITLHGVTQPPVNFKGSFMNTKSEKSVIGIVRLKPKEEYSLTAQLLLQTKGGKKRPSTKYVPTFVVKTPKTELVALRGTAEYKTDKQIKTDVTLNINKVLKDRIHFKADLLKSETKGKRQKYKGHVLLASEFVTGKLSGNIDIKKSGSSSSRLTLDYNLPRVKKNKITFSSKIINRSTKTLTKYIVNTNFDVKQNPECNFVVDLDLNHNSRHSEANVKMRHGENVRDNKDKRKELQLSVTLNHKFVKQSVFIDYNVRAKYELKDVDFLLKGDHQHDKKSLSSSMALRYTKSKHIEGSIKLKDKSKKRLIRMEGSATLKYPGRDFQLITNLTQTSKKSYLHTINMQLQKGEKSTLVTTYANPTPNTHEVSSEAVLHGHDPVRLDFSTTLEPRNFKVSGEVNRKQYKYGVSLTSRVNKSPYGKWSLDLNYPDKHITANAEGGKQGDKYSVIVEALLNADKDPRQKVTGKIIYNNDKGKSKKIGGTIDFRSPFKNMEKISGEFDYSNERNGLSSRAQISWGGEQQQLSANMNFVKPFSWKNIDLNMAAVTPFKSFERMEFSVMHRYGSSLLSQVKGKWGQKYFDAKVEEEHSFDTVRRSMRAAFDFKSSIKHYKTMALRFSHTDEHSRYQTNAEFNDNGDRYAMDFDGSIMKVGWDFNARGKLDLTSPKKNIRSTLTHRHAKSNFKTTLDANWGQGKTIHVDINADHENIVRRKITGGIIIQTPWDSARDIDISVNHEHARGFVKIQNYYKQDGKTYASLVAMYTKNHGQSDFEFTLVNPFTVEDLIGKINVRYERSPWTLHTELQWSRTNKISVDGFLDAVDLKKIDGNIRVTTPFEGATSIVLMVKHGKEGREWSSKANLEFGLRKFITAESRVRLDAVKKFRTTISTSFSSFQNLDTGFEFAGPIKDFNANADIEIRPVMGKLNGEINWSMVKDYTGKLRIDTPFKQFRYLQVSTSWKLKQSVRRSWLEIDYYPKKIISLETKYNINFNEILDSSVAIKTPYEAFPYFEADVMFKKAGQVMEGKASMKTPFEKLKTVSSQFNHAHSSKAVQTHAEINYFPGKTIETDLHVQLQGKIDGTLSFQSPYEGMRNIRVNFNHEGKWKQFQSHGEILYNGKRIETDLNFGYGATTRGTLIFKSPFQGFQNVKAEIFHQGNLKNFKMSGKIEYGRRQKSIVGTAQHKWTDARFSVAGVLKTPYSEDVKITLDHKGEMKDFTNKALVSYGKMYKFDSETTFRLKDLDVSLASSVDYLWKSKGRKVGVSVIKEGPLENFKVEVGATCAEKTLKVGVTFHKADDIKATLRIQTPFTNYTDYGVTFDHSGNSNRFVSIAKLQYTDNDEIFGKVDFFRNKWRRVETTVELRTPFTENANVHYEHSVRKELVKTKTEITYGQKYRYASDFSVTRSDLPRFSLDLETNHKGYKQMNVAGDYQKVQNQHRLTASANLGKHGQMSLQSFVDISKPLTGDATITTSYEGFETIKVYFTHGGKLRNFKTTVTFNSPKTDAITSEVYWRYVAADSLNGLLTIKSKLKHLKNIKLALRNSKNGQEYLSHAEVGWEEEKVISLDGSYRFEKKWHGVELSSGLAMTTPFDALHRANVKIDHMHNKEKVTEKAAADYNGKTYLDADMEYEYGIRHSGSVNVREPRPMAMTVTGRFDKKQFDSDLYLNWNKDDIESNVRFEGAFNDQSDARVLDTEFKFKIIHPARILGVEGLMKKNKRKVQHKTLLTWDQKMGNTFAYDVEWNDRSRPFSDVHDGSLKLVLPVRSIKVSGRVSNSSHTRSMDANLLWDADRDQTKQVGVKTNFDWRGKSQKTSLTLHLPTINKDYQLSTDMIVNQGATIFDGRTELSYSPDPRKTLVLTTKLESLARISNNKNVSIAFGIAHPATNINLQVTSHLGHSDRSCSAGAGMIYLTAAREKKNFALRWEIDRLRRQMDLQMLSPMKQVEINGQMDMGSPYHLKLKNTYDNNNIINTDVIVDPRRRSLELSMNYDSDNPDDRLFFSARLLNDTALQAELHREKDFRKISDSLIDIHLNTSHILHTRITWRPEFVPELQRYVSNKVQIYSYTTNDIFSAISVGLGHEVAGKYKAIAQEISQEAAPLFEFLEKEMGNVKLNLEYVKRELGRMYRRNDLYIKDMGETFNTMFGSFREFVDSYSEIYILTERTLTQWMQTVRSYPMAQKYSEFLDNFINYLKRARQIGIASYNKWSLKMEAYSAQMYQVYLQKTRQLQRKITATMNAVTQHPQFQKMQAKYNYLRSKLAYLPEMDYKEYGHMLHNQLQNGLEKVQMKKTYDAVITNTKDLFQTQFAALMKRREFRQAHAMGNELYQQGLWLYKYWGVDTNLRLALQKLFELTKDMLFMELNMFKDSLVNIDKSRIIVYDPQHGELQFELYLPVPLKSLTELPDFNVKRYIRRFRNFADRYIPGKNYSVWDTYYNMVPSLDATEWIPPFRGYAAVIGDQHFITFDKSHFDFIGRCSYVLVRDMVDDNFTVVLNYDHNIRNPKKKSLLVMLRGVNIEVSPGYKVMVDEKPMELPFIFGKIIALRENHVIRIEDGDGLTVEVDPEHDVYTIGVSGWYFGKTGGLLGTYDNEKANDMMASDQTTVQDVNRFANSWEVGRRNCRSRNMIRTTNTPKENDTGYQTCTNYFKSQWSHFRRCYSQVDPNDFFDMCLGYLNTEKTEEQARCKAAAQYHHQCRTNGVYLSMPAECVTCPALNGDNFQKGTEITLSPDRYKYPVPSSADVILVMEERKSKTWTPTSMGNLVTEIDNALRSSGIQNNQFGLVGFGGIKKLLTEHSHTFDGQLFTNSRGFLKGVEHIQFSKDKKSGSAMDALRMASHYPFRTGVSKIIVFIPASPCETDLANIDMEDHLKANGFTLHILRNDTFEIMDNRPFRNARIFGIDNAQVLTMKQKSKKNQEFFKYLVKPNDHCSSLAFSTNGSIFDVRHMTDKSTRVQKDFIRTFANRVGDTARPPQCQKCTCQQDAFGDGKAVCKPCDRSFALWNYLPNWWSSNRTPYIKDSFRTQLQDYLQLNQPSQQMEIKDA